MTNLIYLMILNIGKLEFEDLFLDKPELEAVVFDIADENEYEMIA